MTQGQAVVTEALQRSRENSSSSQQQQRPSHSDLEQYEVIDVDNPGDYQATSLYNNDHTEEQYISQQTTFEAEAMVSVC